MQDRYCFTLILRQLNYLAELGLTPEEARILTSKMTETTLSAEDKALIPQIQAMVKELEAQAKAKRLAK